MQHHLNQALAQGMTERVAEPEPYPAQHGEDEVASGQVSAAVSWVAPPEHGQLT